jgi:hypothetical protein
MFSISSGNPAQYAFRFRSRVHPGRHPAARLNFKNSSLRSSDSLKFLTPTNRMALSPGEQYRSTETHITLLWQQVTAGF